MERIWKVMNQQSFEAKIVMTVTPGKTSEAASPSHNPGPMDMLMTMSEGKSRVEMDFSRMMGGVAAGKGGMPPGLDKMVTISRPDKKVIYQVVPGLSAYCEMPIPDVSAGKSAPSKIDRTVEGNEKVQSYNCEKVRNTITTADGKTVTVLTWEAKELKGFPVKMETETPEGRMTMLFQDIKTTKPPRSVFEPPEGYTKYGSMQELMMSGMMKMMPKTE